MPGGDLLPDGPPPFLHGLKLSDAQEDKIFQLNHSAAPAIHEQTMALRRAHEGLADMESSAQFDEQKAKAIADSGARADSQLRLLRVRLSRDIRAVLTPEQRSQLDQRREAHDHGPPGRRPPG